MCIRIQNCFDGILKVNLSRKRVFIAAMYVRNSPFSSYPTHTVCIDYLRDRSDLLSLDGRYLRPQQATHSKFAVGGNVTNPQTDSIPGSLHLLRALFVCVSSYCTSFMHAFTICHMLYTGTGECFYTYPITSEYIRVPPIVVRTSTFISFFSRPYDTTHYIALRYNG
jgi:hypothetical protein